MNRSDCRLRAQHGSQRSRGNALLGVFTGLYQRCSPNSGIFCQSNEVNQGPRVLERKINELFGDDGPTGFGTGWGGGVLSAFFGMLAFGAVGCPHFPQLLSSPELRPHYPMPLIRMLIQAVIVAAIVLGVASAFLREKKILGLTGLLRALAATLLGGASGPINETLHDGPAIGLDWFLLDLLLMTLIFSPIEVLWPAYPKKGGFRPEWSLDVVYFLSTHLPIRITTFLVLLPATQLTRILGNAGLQEAMGSPPRLVPFVLAGPGAGRPRARIPPR